METRTLRSGSCAIGWYTCGYGVAETPSCATFPTTPTILAVSLPSCTRIRRPSGSRPPR
jgi:hypothetical protein